MSPSVTFSSVMTKVPEMQSFHQAKKFAKFRIFMLYFTLEYILYLMEGTKSLFIIFFFHYFSKWLWKAALIKFQSDVPSGRRFISDFSS